MAEMYPLPTGSTSTVGGGQGNYVKTPRRAPDGALPDPPSFSSIAPTSGPDTGGTAVTITGTFPSAIQSVTFGAAPATSVVRVNATTITCVTPANAAGGYVISVTDTSNQTGSSGPDAFLYTAGGPE